MVRISGKFPSSPHPPCSAMSRSFLCNQHRSLRLPPSFLRHFAVTSPPSLRRRHFAIPLTFPVRSASFWNTKNVGEKSPPSSNACQSKPPAKPVVCTTPSRRYCRQPDTGSEKIRQLQLFHRPPLKRPHRLPFKKRFVTITS